MLLTACLYVCLIFQMCTADGSVSSNETSVIPTHIYNLFPPTTALLTPTPENVNTLTSSVPNPTSSLPITSIPQDFNTGPSVTTSSLTTISTPQDSTTTTPSAPLTSIVSFVPTISTPNSTSNLPTTSTSEEIGTTTSSTLIVPTTSTPNPTSTVSTISTPQDTSITTSSATPVIPSIASPNTTSGQPTISTPDDSSDSNKNLSLALGFVGGAAVLLIVAILVVIVIGIRIQSKERKEHTKRYKIQIPDKKSDSFRFTTTRCY